MMAVMTEDNLSWRTLVNLQMRLMSSKETNAEFDKRITELEATKGELQQRVEKLRLSSKKDTVESLLEDREIVFLTQEREEALTKQTSLVKDLKSVTNLLGKFKLDIDRSNKSVNNLEVSDFLTVKEFVDVCRPKNYMFICGLSSVKSIANIFPPPSNKSELPECPV